MSSYNLNDNVSDSFEFEVGGHKYEMVYPTLEDAQKVQKLVEDADGDAQKSLEPIYKFIKPKGESPNISSVMKKQNVRVLQNFKKMMEAEFGEVNG